MPEKEPVKSIGVPNLTSFTVSLFHGVLDGSVGMNEAETRLRKHLMDLTTEDRETSKKQMYELANRIRQVSDGFTQALTVLGSRQ